MEYQMEKHLKQIRDRIGTAPDALAVIRGGADTEGADGAKCGPCGAVYFFQEEGGVLVMADLYRLPEKKGNCGGDFYGFHIHVNGDCSGTAAMPFENAGGHFNPEGCGHPYHAGDLPPVYGTREGRGFLLFFTDRFHVDDIIGRSVIVHGSHDDFTSQPSGNAGPMIGCGRIIGG